MSSFSNSQMTKSYSGRNISIRSACLICHDNALTLYEAGADMQKIPSRECSKMDDSPQHAALASTSDWANRGAFGPDGLDLHIAGGCDPRHGIIETDGPGQFDAFLDAQK